MVQELPMAQGNDGCGCGCAAPADAPVLDARAIPHEVRHAAIFGALDSIGAGSALVLVAPHDPIPLLAQAEERYGDSFAVEYLESGPEDWRLRFARTADRGNQ